MVVLHGSNEFKFMNKVISFFTELTAISKEMKFVFNFTGITAEAQSVLSSVY